ncbi:hypothetical protein [Terrisporobacter sp.]
MGIGPSTKETTLHHFRDPLLDIVSNDEEIREIKNRDIDFTIYTPVFLI